MPKKGKIETPAPQPAGVSVSKKRKRRLRYEPTRNAAAWSRDDIATLRLFWGVVDIDEVAERLLRTPYAVARKVRDLKIPTVHGIKAIRTASAESGYGIHRLRIALVALKLRPRMIPRTDTRQAKKTGRSGYTDPEWSRVYAWLKQFPDGEPLPNPASKLTPAIAWGTGGKPAACVVCARVTLPHYARGKCTRCYRRQAHREHRARIRARA